MRIALAAAAAALLLAVFAFASPAGADPICSFPPSAYSTGGSPSGGVVNDPLFPRQWGLDQIHAPAAWQHGYRGAGATVAIVDTGVDLTHPDLQGHIVGGADLADSSACPGAQDENGHGTHVAGIAAAVTNNGIGGAGTAPDASIMPVRILDASGSADDATVIKGIKYAADNGAKVINLSLGGSPIIGELPQANQDMADAVAYAFSKGAVVVAAAGNESIPLCSYPAAAKEAVCVAATDSRGLPTFYSNFPASPNGNVSVRAPGGVGSIFCEDDEDIWSSIWPGSSDDCQGSGSLTGYDTLAGTSMSAPFVSGVAAMLAAKGLSAGQILECLKTTSSNGGSYDPVYGYGIVDADAATSTCSPQATASFVAGGSAQGGSPQPGVSGSSGSSSTVLIVRVKRTTKRKLARTRKLQLTITNNKPLSVKLKAVLKRRAAGSRTLASKVLALTRAGTHAKTLKLSRRSVRTILRSRRSSLRVLYRSGSITGAAKAF
jgi:subtilisin family serine protease